MNCLPFIFSILIVLSFGSLLSLQKKMDAERVQRFGMGHVRVAETIRSKTEKMLYRYLPGKEVVIQKKEPSSQKQKIQRKDPLINPKCARLSLRTLVEKGREEAPLEYRYLKKLVENFYLEALFQGDTSKIDPFLKRWLNEVQKNPTSSLENIALSSPRMQRVYYRMLKGCKEGGYPSFLEYVSLEKTSKICLGHAKKNVLTLLLGKRAAEEAFDRLQNSCGMDSKKLEDFFVSQGLFLEDREGLSLCTAKKHAKEEPDWKLIQDKKTGVILRQRKAF